MNVQQFHFSGITKKCNEVKAKWRTCPGVPYNIAITVLFHKHTRTHARTRTCTHACSHGSTHTHTHTHVHTHTHTHTHTVIPLSLPSHSLSLFSVNQLQRPLLLQSYIIQCSQTRRPRTQDYDTVYMTSIPYTCTPLHSNIGLMNA